MWKILSLISNVTEIIQFLSLSLNYDEDVDDGGKEADGTDAVH